MPFISSMIKDSISRKVTGDYTEHDNILKTNMVYGKHEYRMNSLTSIQLPLYILKGMAHQLLFG